MPAFMVAIIAKNSDKDKEKNTPKDSVPMKKEINNKKKSKMK